MLDYPQREKRVNQKPLLKHVKVKSLARLINRGSGSSGSQQKILISFSLSLLGSGSMHAENVSSALGFTFGHPLNYAFPYSHVPLLWY